MPDKVPRFLSWDSRPDSIVHILFYTIWIKFRFNSQLGRINFFKQNIFLALLMRHVTSKWDICISFFWEILLHNLIMNEWTFFNLCCWWKVHSYNSKNIWMVNVLLIDFFIIRNMMNQKKFPTKERLCPKYFLNFFNIHLYTYIF